LLYIDSFRRHYLQDNYFRMKRRNFILIGTAGIAAISIPSAFYFFGDVQYDKSLSEPRSLSLIWDSQTIASIGNQYRLQTPAENSRRKLVRKLLDDISDQNGEMTSLLEEKIIKDFETGDTIIADGWILSITEARQCALFSIDQ